MPSEMNRIEKSEVCFMGVFVKCCSTGTLSIKWFGVVFCVQQCLLELQKLQKLEDGYKTFVRGVSNESFSKYIEDVVPENVPILWKKVVGLALIVSNLLISRRSMGRSGLAS